MTKASTEKESEKPDVDEDDSAEDRAADADASDEEETEEKDASEKAKGDADAGEAGDPGDDPEGATGEAGSEEDPDESVTPAQLGAERYVMAAFLAAGMLGAYIIGKALHGLWAFVSNKEWFYSKLATLAGLSDDDKNTYSIVVGAVISLIVVVRAYRRPSVRSWADEVASELAKVKWPSRKEVSNSTVVVIAAGAIATVYLALVDQTWSFITDLFYPRPEP